MPLPPPPNALSLEEFTRRYNMGARTLAEIDPVFESWRKNNGIKGFVNRIYKMIRKENSKCQK